MLAATSAVLNVMFVAEPLQACCTITFAVSPLHYLLTVTSVLTVTLTVIQLQDDHSGRALA